MFEHSFTLVIEGDVESHLDELFEAGCEDATFGSVDGVHYADFDREAETLGRAISSTIADVESVPGLVVRRVEPDDLVTASEIAERLGRTRESVRLLIAGKRGAGDFPAPISHLRSRNRLWRWSDVVEWADEASAAEVDRARLIAAYNAALELRNKASDLSEEARGEEEKIFEVINAKARPVLLEPYVKVEVLAPTELVGDIMGDLSGRRGRPMGIEQRGERQVIQAEVPLVEMLTYARDLRSITGGRANFHVEPGHYEEVPPNLVEKVLAANAREEEKEKVT